MHTLHILLKDLGHPNYLSATGKYMLECKMHPDSADREVQPYFSTLDPYMYCGTTSTVT
jgi:hypothetical protein